METILMRYYRGYKYVVAQTFSVQVPITGYEIKDKLTSLTRDGLLTIERWYAWDGPTRGLDTRSSMRCSCAHDVLCDFVNLGWLPETLQPVIDQIYYNLGREDGMWKIRAMIDLLAIRWYMTEKGAKRYNRKIYSTGDEP